MMADKGKGTGNKKPKNAPIEEEKQKLTHFQSATTLHTADTVPSGQTLRPPTPQGQVSAQSSNKSLKAQGSGASSKFPDATERTGPGAIFEVKEETFLRVMKPIVSHQLETMSTLKHLQRQMSDMLGDEDPLTVKGPGTPEAYRKPGEWRGLFLLTFFLIVQIAIQLYFKDLSLRAW